MATRPSSSRCSRSMFPLRKWSIHTDVSTSIVGLAGRTAARRRGGPRIGSAKRLQTLRALARDQRAQPLVHDAGFFLNPTERLGARDQFGIQNERRSHAYKY